MSLEVKHSGPAQLNHHECPAFDSESSTADPKYLLEIGKDCADRLKEPFCTLDHADLLYDEKGLPR